MCGCLPALGAIVVAVLVGVVALTGRVGGMLGLGVLVVCVVGLNWCLLSFPIAWGSSPLGGFLTLLCVHYEPSPTSLPPLSASLSLRLTVVCFWIGSSVVVGCSMAVFAGFPMVGTTAVDALACGQCRAEEG